MSICGIVLYLAGCLIALESEKLPSVSCVLIMATSSWSVGLPPSILITVPSSEKEIAPSPSLSKSLNVDFNSVTMMGFR